MERNKDLPSLIQGLYKPDELIRQKQQQKNDAKGFISLGIVFFF